MRAHSHFDPEKIRHWVFDLDNTLYAPSLGVLDELYQRSALFIQAELGLDESSAHALKDRLAQRHGSIAKGLEVEHGIPQGKFHRFIHEISLERIAANPALRGHLQKISGDLLVHTNAPRFHAETVLARLGVGDLIDDIFSIERANGLPKPHRENFLGFVLSTKIHPGSACFFDDQQRNLCVPKEMGMKTVWVSHIKAHEDFTEGAADIDVCDLDDFFNHFFVTAH